jgi:hypothetical protein
MEDGCRSLGLHYPVHAIYVQIHIILRHYSEYGEQQKHLILNLSLCLSTTPRRRIGEWRYSSMHS